MNYEDQRAQPRFENLTMQDDRNISNIYRIMLISFITDVPWIMIRKIIQSMIKVSIIVLQLSAIASV